MNNSNYKRNVAGSGKGDVLSDLQKQKEKILRDMEEQKRKKLRELEQKKIKTAPPPVVLPEKVKEKTPPIKKIRVESKSFAEIMKEAENRAKHNVNISELPQSKKIKQTESSLPSIPIKRKLSNNIDATGQSVISNKKIKLTETKVQSEKSKPKSLMPINLIAKQNSTVKNNYETAAKISNKPSNTQKSSNYPPAKNIGTISQVLKPSQSGILAQSSSRNPTSISNHLNNKDKINKSKNPNPIQNPPKSLNKASKESNLKVSSKTSANIKQNENKSNCAIRNQSQNNNNNNHNSKSISQNTTRINPSSSNNKGITAQNAMNSNKISQRSSYSSATPAKGIAAQNRNYQSQKGISSGPPPRGIAAQSNARGILAQSGNRLPMGDNYRSDSDYEDEYDSELDDFIDDTEFVVDDKIKKEIYKSLNFDPNKYAKVSKYDDCTNMVSRFDDICKEEIRSSRIGREEDMLELRELEKANQKKMKMKSKY